MDVVFTVGDGHPSRNRSVARWSEVLLACKTPGQLTDPPSFTGQWVLLMLFKEYSDRDVKLTVCLRDMHSEDVISVLHVGPVCFNV